MGRCASRTRGGIASWVAVGRCGSLWVGACRGSAAGQHSASARTHRWLGVWRGDGGGGGAVVAFSALVTGGAPHSQVMNHITSPHSQVMNPPAEAKPGGSREIERLASQVRGWRSRDTPRHGQISVCVALCAPLLLRGARAGHRARCRRLLRARRASFRWSSLTECPLNTRLETGVGLSFFLSFFLSESAPGPTSACMAAGRLRSRQQRVAACPTALRGTRLCAEP
jgi:hypothetical protein